MLFNVLLWSLFEMGNSHEGKKWKRGTGKTKVGKDLFILAQWIPPDWIILPLHKHSRIVRMAHTPNPGLKEKEKRLTCVKWWACY